MPIIYPLKTYKRFGLEFGITYALINEKFGVDLGEQYHLDMAHRIKTDLAIDRAVFDAYGSIGLGYENPFPHTSVSPFGNYFMPVMYGCRCNYAAAADPAVSKNSHNAEQIGELKPWTIERFEKSEPVRVILSQIDYLKKHYEHYRVPQKNFSPISYKDNSVPDGLPHYRQMSAHQNPGSVINTAFSIQGEQLYMDYFSAPDSVHKLYDNIANLTMISMDYFQQIDGWPLTDVFVGNCSVAMISPAHYAQFNYQYDRRLMEYARSIGARFMMHQDSDVNKHLENYTKFDYLHFIDFGQDTDFEKLAKLFPSANANCLLFPSWVQFHSIEEIREELLRLMTIGKAFRSFSFSLLEIDQELGKGKIFEFFEVFRECAAKF
jgi:hypothetical protein